jgi:cytochrome c6
MNASLRRLAAAFSALVALTAASSGAFADQATLDLGKKVFLELAEPACSVCHALAAAGATGTVGPSLDTMRPDAEQVEAAVTNGVGVMPAFEALSPEQIAAVAQYVATAAKPQ